MKKIDVHTHCFRDRFTMGTQSVPSVDDFLNNIFDEMGVSECIQLPSCFEQDITKMGKAYEDANMLAYNISQEHPNKFHWFCNIDPRMNNFTADEDLTPYLKRYKDLGAIGFGEVTSNLYIDDPYMENLFKSLEELQLPVLFHMAPNVGSTYGMADDIGLPRLEKALQKFPKLIFIGHSQVFWAEISSDVNEETREGYPTGSVTPGRLSELLSKYPNLYADISAGSGYTALTRDPEYGYKFLEEFQDKLMFGSDYLIPRGTIKTPQLLDEAVKEGKISRQAYEKIIRKNAEKLFHI